MKDLPFFHFFLIFLFAAFPKFGGELLYPDRFGVLATVVLSLIHIYPLMEETLAKALQDSPARMQTGPAMRGDAETVRRHLNLLANNPEWREIYRELSENINPDLKV